MEQNTQAIMFKSVCKDIDKCEPIEFYKERIEYLETLIRKYKFDYLTGLMGKQDFNDKFDRVFEEYQFADKPFHLAIVDIDGLHNLNRTKGYFAGDTLIKSVAKQLESLFHFHQIYRISGDEFVVVVRDVLTSKEEMVEKLEQLESITYAIATSTGYTSPKQMFKLLDAELSKKKNSVTRM